MKLWTLFIAFLLVLIYIFTLRPNKHINPVDTKVDTVFKHINDSIIVIIDSSNTKIKYINNWYEKELIDITNQSVAADVEFFTKYLEAQTDK